uniref:Uncharacterized protein n=1 Tax=Ascaris lumbricoides TaxID=6252 RepID=A0A0M3HWK4_ASCLU
MPIPKMGTYGRASDTIAENNEERTEFVRTTWSEAYYTKLRTFSHWKQKGTQFISYMTRQKIIATEIALIKERDF